MILRGRWRLISSVFALLLSAGTLPVAACGLDWNGPVNFSYGIGQNGNVSIVRELARLPLKSAEIPLLMIFDSKKRSDSARTGAFRIPLLESSLWAQDENSYLLYTPAGEQWNFRRINADSRLWEGPYGFKMELVGDVATIRAECGAKLVYVRGRISQIQIKEATLDYVYSGSAASEIRRDGKTWLRIESEPGSTSIRRLVFDSGEELEFQWGQRPVVEKQGDFSVVSRMAKTIVGFSKKTGESESYSFDLPQDLTPQLLLNGKTIFQWNTSGDVKRVDSESYEIDRDPANPAAFKISRLLADDKRESFTFDGKGQKKIFQYPDGRKVENSYFSSGALAGKLRQAVETLPSGKVTMKERNSYDENGRILRINREDDSTMFSYDDHEGSVTARDGKSNFLWKKFQAADGKTIINYADGKVVTIDKTSGKQTLISITKNGKTISAKRGLDDNFVVETTPTKQKTNEN